MIRQFSDLTSADANRAGTLAAGLGDLSRGDLPVVPGFVVTTLAYDRFVGRNGLTGRLLTAAAAEQLGRDRGTARRLILRGEFDHQLASELRSAARRLRNGDQAVIVRASYPEPERFVPQAEGFARVVDGDDIVSAVRECWASLWTASAIQHRARTGADPAKVSVAVVVQRLVAADAAGTLTTDEADSRTLVLSEDEPRVIDLRAAEQRSVLNTRQAEALAKLGEDVRRQAAASGRHAQQVQWARHGDELMILGSGNASSLSALPVRSAGRQGRKAMLAGLTLTAVGVALAAVLRALARR